MNPYINNLSAFADLLQACNIVHEEAVYDPDGYDGEVTMRRIAEAHKRLRQADVERKVDAGHAMYRGCLLDQINTLRKERDEARQLCAAFRSSVFPLPQAFIIPFPWEITTHAPHSQHASNPSNPPVSSADARSADTSTRSQ